MSFFASSSSNPKSSSSVSAWLYDVFLTFHTKHLTISSLESSLRDSAIKTFTDHNKEVRPTLLEAIGRSRIVIVVFTKEFGCSRECLNKLDKIMECHKNTGKMVFAVFCGVSPSEVRQQNDRLAGGSRKDREVARWRRQLTEATRLFGWTVSASSSTR